MFNEIDMEKLKGMDAKYAKQILILMAEVGSKSDDYKEGFIKGISVAIESLKEAVGKREPLN